MRKGFFGAFHLGGLEAMNNVLQMAEGITGQKGCDVEGLFYATAFQAGIDRFLIPSIADVEPPRSTFVCDRTTFLQPERSDTRTKPIRDSFDGILPAGWRLNGRYRRVWAWEAFLTDLFEAMEEGAALLAVMGVPDPTELVNLAPSELTTPVSNLANQFEILTAPSVVPQIIVPREGLDRFQQVLLSDAFSGYVTAQASLDHDEMSVRTAMERVVAAGRQLVRTDPRLLAIRHQAVGVLTVTPKLIDAVLGKLPGVLSEVAARYGITFLKNRRRLVVYDFDDLLQKTVLVNLVRMFERSGSRKNLPS